MTIAEDDARLRFVSLNKATELKEGIVYCYLNRYWAVHPTKGIIFYRPDKQSHGGHPQCNSNKLVTESLVTKLYPWAVIQLIPVVIERIDPKDYC